MAQIFAECINAANVLTVSRLNDPEKTAGIGLALIFVNFICMSILCGLNQAISVPVAIAFGQ